MAAGVLGFYQNMILQVYGLFRHVASYCKWMNSKIRSLMLSGTTLKQYITKLIAHSNSKLYELFFKIQKAKYVVLSCIL